MARDITQEIIFYGIGLVSEERVINCREINVQIISDTQLWPKNCFSP